MFSSTSVGAFAFALHAQAVTAVNQFLHHGFRETVLDLKAQRVVLKRGHRHGLDVRGHLALGHRLVAFAETADG